ncbi:MAG: lamin tail domain-containing protein, partial [bacterium]|nr:lamin tail domain-containing protein [bacterium]
MGNTKGWVALFKSTDHTNKTTASKTIIDYIEYGVVGNTWESSAVAAGIWTAGDYIPNVQMGNSLERQPTGSDTNQSLDFKDQSNPTSQNSASVTLLPTVQCGNGQIESGEQCDDGNLVSGDSCSSTCQTETAEAAPPPADDTATSTPLNPPLSGGTKKIYKLGDVVINEFVSDPADNEVEWIELYNKTNGEINLTGWWIEEGSKAKTKLAGVISASGVGRYKVIDKPAGNLNNSGDIIILYDANGKIIDQIAYGNWDDGNTTDNAPAANDPGGTARKFDGYNTFNNLNDFAETSKPTKGVSNIIETEDEVSAEVKAKFDFS